MSDVLRALLLVGALLMVIYIICSIRRSKIQMKDTIEWLAIALMLFVFGVFPRMVIWLSKIVGVESPANMVFLIFIAILLVKNFKLSMSVSQLDLR